MFLSQTKFSPICRFVYKMCVLFISKKSCSNSGGKKSSTGRLREESKRSVKLLLSAGNSGNKVKQTVFIRYADMLYWQQETDALKGVQE